MKLDDLIPKSINATRIEISILNFKGEIMYQYAKNYWKVMTSIDVMYCGDVALFSHK